MATTLGGLSRACLTNNLEMVRLAIQNGNPPDPYTLDYAINTGNEEIVKAVCFARAIPTTTTLTRACQIGKKAILDLAIIAGATASSDTLTASALSGNIEIFNTISNLATPDQNTLDAVLPKWPWTVEWLIQKGAKPTGATLTKACQVKQNDPNNRDKVIAAVVNAGGRADENTLHTYISNCHYTDWDNKGTYSCNKIGLDALARSGLQFAKAIYVTPKSVIETGMEMRVGQQDYFSFMIDIGFKPTPQDVQTYMFDKINRLKEACYDRSGRPFSHDVVDDINKRISLISNGVDHLKNAYFSKFKQKLV